MPSLVRHPDTPAGAIHTVEAELQRIPGGAVATYRAIGEISRLLIPLAAPPQRADNLWRTTCFELFVATGGSAYHEFNMSPSGAWAAYEFADHRQGRRNIDAKVEIDTSHDNKVLTLVAKIESDLPLSAQVGMTAVLEEADGKIRYWATAFAPGEPDFHAAATRSLLFDGVSAE